MIDHFGPLARFYDRLIPLPDTRRLVALLALPVSGSLLDAGGGTGRAGRMLSGQVDRRVLCDISHGMLRQAVRRGEKLAVRARCESLPFADRRFSRVLVTDALHHFGDVPQALAEMVRVLAPGGRIVIEEPDIGRPLVRVLAWLERLALMGSRFYPPTAIALRLSEAGLTAAVETGSRFSAWIWAQKPGRHASLPPCDCLRSCQEIVHHQEEHPS